MAVGKEMLERYQVALYLLAIALGAALGWASPTLGAALEPWLWPVLAGLLYATFTQVPFASVTRALRDIRFLVALMAGNFVIMPAIVWGLVQFVPLAPAATLGVLLVLLMPCTDWFIGFAHLGRGDGARAVAVAPLLLGLQLLLLPLYLHVMLGERLALAPLVTSLLPGIGVILLPLALAALSEKLSADKTTGQRADTRKSALDIWMEAMGWLPVPLLAVVVFLIASAQVQVIGEIGGAFWQLLTIFIAYLAAAALVGKALSVALAPRAGRTLTFSLGTRNSFLVLPLALSLPSGFEVTAIVIVFQSLVELFGMLVYVSLVPRLIGEA